MATLSLETLKGLASLSIDIKVDAESNSIAILFSWTNLSLSTDRLAFRCSTQEWQEGSTGLLAMARSLQHAVDISETRFPFSYYQTSGTKPPRCSLDFDFDGVQLYLSGMQKNRLHVRVYIRDANGKEVYHHCAGWCSCERAVQFGRDLLRELEEAETSFPPHQNL